MPTSHGHRITLCKGGPSALKDWTMAEVKMVVWHYCRSHPGDERVGQEGLCRRPLVGVFAQALQQKVPQLPRH